MHSPTRHETERILRSLTEKTEHINAIRHRGGTIQPKDWSDLFHLTNEAKGLLTIIDEAAMIAPGDLTDEAYIEAARREYQREGAIEIDDHAKISRGDDDGAYVAAWVGVAHTKNQEER
ncbi:MAG: hypothetical protein ABL983_00140 [Nitrospira sp.]